MKILKFKDFIGEGAGAGYTLRFEGIEIDWNSAELTGNKCESRDNVYIEYTVDIKNCILDKWSAIGYYNGVSSDGIEYDGDIVMDYGDDDMHIESGKITCLISETDFIEYKESIDINDNAKAIKQLCENYETKITVEYLYGAGWVHAYLENPIKIGEFDTEKTNSANWVDSTDLEDYHGNYYSYIKNIIINADNIVKDINWYFKNYDDFDDIFGYNDDEQ